VQRDVVIGIGGERRLIRALGLLEPAGTVVLQPALDDLVDSRRP
jgi:hypothetical protein